MNRRTLTSPFGPLTLIEVGGRITELYWGTLPGHAAGSGLPDRAALQVADYFAGTRTAFTLPLAPAFRRAFCSR